MTKPFTTIPGFKPDAPDPSEDEKAFGRFFRFPWQFEEPRSPTLIKGMLALGDELLVYGPPEAGKSFYMVDMACCWASGEPWRGRQVEQGIVVYLAGERKQSIQNRVRAWALRHGLPLEKVPVAVLNASVNLLAQTRDDLKPLIEGIDAARRIIDRPVISIIEDTVHSLSPGTKEDNQSFGLIVDRTRWLRDSIRQQEPIANAYVHHTGKDEARGPRGGNSLPAAVSLSMAISVRLEKYRLVEIDKGNDLAERPHIEPFVIETVTLRHEADGTPVKAGVHVPIAITDIPDLTDDELKAIALRLHREGKSQRYIAKAVGRDQSRISRWLTPEGARKKPQGGDAP